MPRSDEDARLEKAYSAQQTAFARQLAFQITKAEAEALEALRPKWRKLHRDQAAPRVHS